MTLCNAATTPTRTQLCSVTFPFDILPGICFLCWKTSSLGRRDPLGCSEYFCFVYFPTMAVYKSHEGVWHRIHKCDTTFPSSKISSIPKWLIFNTHQGRVKSISTLLATPNAAKHVYKAGNTDIFSRAHFMVGKPLRTADSIHVCSHLITVFVVWSLKAVKWENPAACNRSLTAREQLQQIPDALFQLRHKWTHIKSLHV